MSPKLFFLTFKDTKQGLLIEGQSKANLLKKQKMSRVNNIKKNKTGIKVSTFN